MSDSTKVIVMRYAVFMEDEGRSEIVQEFDSIAAAQKWIAAQEGEYFKPSDYYMVTR